MNKSQIHKIDWVDQQVYVYADIYKRCQGQASSDYKGLLSIEWNLVTCPECIKTKGKEDE